MKRYISGDHHFFHQNIIRYTQRPFSSIQEMNAVLEANWNALVEPQDTIYCLGDFAFTRRGEYEVGCLFERLHGHKILVKGNHDKAFTLGLPWEEVYKESVEIDGVVLVHDGSRFVRENPGAKETPIFCVVPGTRILTADLQWVPIETLKVGDVLVGFEENIPHGRVRGRARHMIPSTVLMVSERVAPLIEVRTDHSTIVVSEEHPFLVQRYRNCNDYKTCWMPAKELRPGTRILYCSDPWEHDQSYEAAWLAGFADGEGSVSKTDGRVTLTQKLGIVKDRAVHFLQQRGYTPWIGQKPNGVCQIQIQIHRDALRFLGSIRPIRLLQQAYKTWIGRRIGGKKRAQGYPIVETIRYLEPGIVISITTSTKTYFAEGYASHNCGNVHDIWKIKENILNLGVDCWHFLPVKWDTAMEYWRSRWEYWQGLQHKEDS